MTSQAHLRSGASAEKSRPSTFGATGCGCEESVVLALNRRATFDRTPSSRISLATVFSHTFTPSARSAACTRGLP